MEDTAIKKALDTLEFLSQDDEARRLYEERQKAIRDYRSALESERRAALEEGKKEVARNMLRKGLDINLIVEVTGLTEEEVRQLQQELERT